MQDDLVTVVVPAHNEVDSIADCLDSILSQDYDNLEVLVVDAESRDGTRELVSNKAAEDHRISLLHNNRRNISSSLNLALRHAHGRWWVRVDAHSTIGAGYISTAVGHLKGGQWGGVGGRKDAVSSVPSGRAIAAVMQSKFGVGNSQYHLAENPQTVDHIPFGAYPLALVRRLGGWNEGIAANEDFEFDYRLRQTGMPLLLDPSMKISWRCRESIKDLYWQYHRYGKGKASVAILHPTSMRLRHWAPPTLVVYSVVGSMIGVRKPPILAAVFAPYLAANALASTRTARELTARERMLVPSAFAAMHVGWGVGFWVGVVHRIYHSCQRKPAE